MVFSTGVTSCHNSQGAWGGIVVVLAVVRLDDDYAVVDE